MINPSKNPDNFETPPSTSYFPADMMEEASVPYTGEEEQADATSSEVLRVKKAYEAQLMAIDGVVGVGIQQNEIGDEVIWIYLRDESIRRQISSELEGVTVITEVVGEFEAY